MRLDAYLAEHYPEHSRATWQKYIKQGFITVSDKPATSAAQAISDSDKIKISIPDSKKGTIDLPIIYEDENVIVIDKPAGVLTHSKGVLNDEPTVADFIKSHSGNSDLAANNRFGIVHRLDRLTSGVIIGAKNEAAKRYLQRQFSERKVKKTYLAIVSGTLKEPAFRIDLPIARNPKKPATFRVDSKGKSAITDVKLVQVLPNGDSMLELKPLTGRTHQLRVHLAYVGHPIVGDPIYGQPADHMYLHANTLEITIPGGQREIFTAPLPAYFEKEING